MPTADGALKWLCDPISKVSSHYFVDEDGKVTQLVAESVRGHHAGVSSWEGTTDINSRSIGIEIVNPGHEFGYRPFPEEQMSALIPLVADIVDRYNIPRANVVGHSDVAPARKQDPGELFDWQRLARVRLALPIPDGRLVDPYWSDGAFMLALERFGYDISDGRAATTAFQRRWRPGTITGEIDGECRAILFALLLDRDAGRTR
ncbi:MAG: N-acetylmuramoyl-L-alanine amidase [Blastomonas sp.]|nr:N-acetylmuramoyl-L-alanine amidase [Blastomonas sp.]